MKYSTCLKCSLPAYMMLTAICAALPISAQMRFYSNESAFLTSAGAVVTETFDTYPNYTYLRTPRIELNGVVYDSSPEADDWEISNLYGSVSPSNTLHYTDIDAQCISSNEDRTVTSFGFWLLVYDDPNDNAQWEHKVSVTELNGNTSIYKLISPPGNRRHYLGFTSAIGIEHLLVDYVHFPETTINGAANWAYDNVSVGAVPEPSGQSIFIIGSSLGIVGGKGKFFHRH